MAYMKYPDLFLSADSVSIGTGLWNLLAKVVRQLGVSMSAISKAITRKTKK
jgi:hypothetical protein